MGSGKPTPTLTLTLALKPNPTPSLTLTLTLIDGQADLAHGWKAGARGDGKWLLHHPLVAGHVGDTASTKPDLLIS